MNDTVAQPSDNHLDLISTFLRRTDQPVSAARPTPLSDVAPSLSAPEEQHHEPERWDGMA